MVEIINDIIRMSEHEFQDVCDFIAQNKDDPMRSIKALHSIGVLDHDIAELQCMMKPVEVIVELVRTEGNSFVRFEMKNA